MSLPTSVLGFGVGFLVGLTGMGGGAVMTPALILLGWSRPIVAVGTDLAWGAITRTVGAWVHYRQRTVDFTVVRRLALGSVPRGPRGSYRSRLPPPNPWSRRGGPPPGFRGIAKEGFPRAATGFTARCYLLPPP